MILEMAETDWLASKNIFYNTRTNQISDNINDLIDVNHIEFHPEGLCNYLDYGYSVFGQTPIKEIKVLPANCKIAKDPKGKICIVMKEDLFEKSMGDSSTPEDTLEYIHYLVNEWEKQSQGKTILPLSGGFDSRLLASMIENKKEVKAYTYGITEKQNESMEVVYAKKLSEILGISWKQIEIGEFHNLFEQWNQMYGISTHAHGMYQMEFYSKIKSDISQGRILSGIYGDLWAGSWKFEEILNPKQLINLAITHEMTADSNFCKIKGQRELRNLFFEENKEKLKEQNWRILLAARMKIILISYLLRVPEYYGFDVWSPFLDFTAVSKMLNLSWDIKERRKWQIEYFRDKNILIGELGLPCDKGNCLNQMAVWRIQPKPLDVKLLGSVMNETYVEQINANLDYKYIEKKRYYHAYLVLYPIQKILELKEYGMTGIKTTEG